MPTKCKIFLGKGRFPLTTPVRGPAPWTPANTSLTDCPSHNSKWNCVHACISVRMREGRRATPPSHFWWQLEEMSHLGNLKLLVEAWNLWWKWCAQIENSLWNYVNFTLGNGFSWAFKTLKPLSFRGLNPPPGPPVPWWNLWWKSTNWQFSARLYVNFAPDFTL